MIRIIIVTAVVLLKSNLPAPVQAAKEALAAIEGVLK